jgi:DNA-binding sugar fermentation-stimulating protein
MGARFSVPVQTGRGAQPASYTMGTGSFPEVNRPGRGVDHPRQTKQKLKKEYSYNCTPLMACSRVSFTFTFTFTEESYPVGPVEVQS